MINYTKRNISFLSLILTLILFISFCIIYSYFQKTKITKSSNNLYSISIQNYHTKNPSYYNENSENNIQNDFLLKNKLNETLLNNNENVELLTKTKKILENSKSATKNVANNTSFTQNSENGTNDNQNGGKEQNLEENEHKEPNSNEKTQTQVLEENRNKTWRIQIPKIDLDAHIAEGITSSVLLTAVGHFEETSKWQGNVGLAAHNRGYKCNFFQDIKNLQIGDEIIYTTANNKKVYKVQTNKVISQTDWSYLQNTKDNRITLITCEENRKDCRRCVQAVEVANYIIN